MSALDDTAAELAAARSEVREALLMAGEWARFCAADDSVAAHIAARIDAAFNRMTAANIAGVTALTEQST